MSNRKRSYSTSNSQAWMNTTECRYPANNNGQEKEMALNITQKIKQTWMNRYPANNTVQQKEITLNIKQPSLDEHN